MWIEESMWSCRTCRCSVEHHSYSPPIHVLWFIVLWTAAALLVECNWYDNVPVVWLSTDVNNLSAYFYYYCHVCCVFIVQIDFIGICRQFQYVNILYKAGIHLCIVGSRADFCMTLIAENEQDMGCMWLISLHSIRQIITLRMTCL